MYVNSRACVPFLGIQCPNMAISSHFSRANHIFRTLRRSLYLPYNTGEKIFEKTSDFRTGISPLFIRTCAKSNGSDLSGWYGLDRFYGKKILKNFSHVTPGAPIYVISRSRDQIGQILNLITNSILKYFYFKFYRHVTIYRAFLQTFM